MEDMTMTESRTYLLNNVDIQIVIDELSRFLDTEKGMDVQTAPTPDGYLLQAGQPKDSAPHSFRNAACHDSAVFHW